MMGKTARAALAVASAALLLLFVLPLWHIRLIAPQYPEGLGLHIYVNTVQGVQPNDLQNINELNHYVGMREITPAAIPELHFMPWVVVVLALLGLAAAAIGRRPLVYAWGALLLVAAGLGLYDFWRWEYTYGHDLSPTAIIKVPGMAYQPPLIGSKQLLNFNATSLPDVGGWIAIFVALLGVALVVWEAMGEPHRRRGAHA
ncbi:MAG TPA: hypothetical protein VF832_12060 [Longimicrobiales bacterium]